MAVWETEDESSGPVASLPTPADTPYRTPSRNVSRGSRKSRRSVTPPGKNGKSSSPPPLPGDRSGRGSKRSSRDVTNDEGISILDPRRFTPTLHASLVSEILSLKRDQEEKLKIIEGLEVSLHSSREEAEGLQATLLTTTKENRSLKRQLALLEGGTSSALGELARERDEAVETASETKKRLETAQKKLRNQEEDSERVHRQWAKEKDEWEEEKRKFERRVHVAETRLKAVLDEVAAYQANQTNGIHNQPESEAEELAKDDGASVRTMSITNSIRFSMANSIVKPNGNSLADELGFDTTEDESDYGGRESVLSHAGHMRTMSRDSVLSRTHRRHQSNDSLMRSGSAARGRLMYNAATLERLEDEVIREDDETKPSPPKVEYTDSAVQYSPPPSPKVVPPKPSTPEPTASPFMQRYERLYDVDSPPRVDVEIEANQRRKRVHIGQPLTIKPPVMNSLMVNGSSQTNADEPLSPPKTPKTPFQESPPTPELRKPTTASASTQTDIPPPLQQPLLNLPMPIPSISITPTSRPTTPREPRLPQLTKDVGCQVSLVGSVSTSEASVQTEEIRIDKRLAKLPLHLHPSTITSRPTSPAIPVEEVATEDSRQFTPLPGNVPPPRNPRRLTAKRSFTDLASSPPAFSTMFEDETHDAYPGNNDDGPLSHQKAPIRRPHRISSLFAGFDGNSSDELDEFLEGDLSDSEYRTALSAPKPKVGSVRGGRRGGSTSTAASSDQILTYKMGGNKYVPRPLDELEESIDFFGSATVFQPRDAGFGRSNSKRGVRSSVLGSKSNVMRRSAMIQSGIASHQRARSPSLPDAKEPPFPIPTRASSRKPPQTVSAPSDGRASPTTGANSWHRRGGGGSRSHYRAGSIRRVRSAAAVQRNQRYRRHASRSPPPLSASTEAPESPGLPPLPANDITTPRTRDSYTYSKYKTHRKQPSATTANTANTENTAAASSAGSTSVVDAIAQTMVGEWMFKYVRRRKSFGVSDTKGGDDSSNDRHKRWVWLAPYERAILWSSKQPSSGSALMGKAGRKLTIQSVLDVKDDNPPPKNAGPVFNRSILILTPQRALKFTATSPERHYIWLTSLSFLAHSNQEIPESLLAPQPKPLPELYEVPKPRARRPGIRDSIRLTKAKTGAVKADPPRTGSSQTDALPPSIPSYRPQLAEPFNIPTHTREISRDAAEPPMIPRFHDRGREHMVHGRKRSNTGGHVPPPLSFRGFSSPIGGAGNSYHAATNSTAGNSIGTAGSSDIYSNGGASSGLGSSGMTWATGSVRTSEASSRPSGPNFFDAIGTVRMEAFISPLAFSRFDETPYEQEDTHRSARRRSKEMRRRASRSRQRDSQSRGTRATDDIDDWYLRDDPFKGF
ncbi:hypothetical protein V8F20_007487 [Naviculisporaceae sp. PSN 640]